MKKWPILFSAVLLPVSIYMGWNSLTGLQRNNLMRAIGECSQKSMKYQGIQRVREFVVELNMIHPGPVSREVRNEFEHYRALWNASLRNYDKTGSLGDYDSDIAASAQKLKDL